MSMSRRDDQNDLVLQTSFSEVSSERPLRISFTTTSSEHPVQYNNSEDTAHINPVMSAVCTEIASPGLSSAFTESGSGRHHDQSCNSPLTQAPSYIQPETGPSVISHQALPTYRQASTSDDGVTPSGHPTSASEPSSYLPESSLPDILYSHIIPRLPPSLPNQFRPQRPHPRHDDRSNRPHQHRHRSNADRSSRHRSHSSWTRSTSSSQIQEGTCKEPCFKCMVTITSFRWVLVVLSILGVCCVITGIVLAALHAAGQSFLFLAIMFIGLGVLLVIVVGVGWKCTPRGHEPLHALFGIGSFMHGRSRGRRHRRHRNRDRNWFRSFGGMLYPEFQFRRPPPSYTTSMQDYQNQVTPEQNERSGRRSSAQNNRGSPPNSPPPSYRSRASTGHSGIHTAFPNIHDGDHPSSRPPTYRSIAPSHRPSFPHEYGIEMEVPEVEDGGASPLVDSSVGQNGEYIFLGAAQNGRTTTSTLSHSPKVRSSVTKAWPDSLSPLKQIASLPLTSQVQALTSERDIQTDNEDSAVMAHNTQNVISESPTTSSSHQQQTFSSASQSETCPPSLHQRMGSADLHILEQALQSLEHINDNTEISNDATSFDDQD